MCAKCAFFNGGGKLRAPWGYVAALQSDPASDVSAQLVRRISPKGILAAAKQTNAAVIVSSHNEPLIHAMYN